MPTELGRSLVEVQRCWYSIGRSQVEVQRCSLSSEGRRLRSSGAQIARKVAKRLAKIWQGRSGRGIGGRGEGGGGEAARTVVIKSNNPHLAGGEKPVSCCRDRKVTLLVAENKYSARVHCKVTYI